MKCELLRESLGLIAHIILFLIIGIYVSESSNAFLRDIIYFFHVPKYTISILFLLNLIAYIFRKYQAFLKIILYIIFWILVLSVFYSRIINGHNWFLFLVLNIISVIFLFSMIVVNDVKKEIESIRKDR